jgi:hypothetical protein
VRAALPVQGRTVFTPPPPPPLQGAPLLQPPLRTERPGSIRDALVRWLNEEL